MADEVDNNKVHHRKLPPLSPRGQTLAEDGVKKVVKKKKKRLPDETSHGEEGKDGDEAQTEPKKRARSRSGSRNRPAVPNGASATDRSTPENENYEQEGIPKKKKRKPKPKLDEDADKTTVTDRKVDETKSETEDVTGSKASLIAKDSEQETPRKKGKKKKKKGVGKDEFGDTVLASDLTYISEDVVSERKQDDEESKDVHFSSPNILRSQPTEKLYIETNRGFKGQNKTKLARKIAEEETTKAIDIVERPSMTTMEFGLQTHKILKTFCLFLHGLLSGIALWHIVIVYILSYHGTVDFLEHYQPIALPVQCMYYILLALCTVSACDRCDVGNTSGRFFMKALSLQNTAIAILIYFLALILSISIIATEDKINLFYSSPELWINPTEAESELLLWRTLNTVRGVAIILGWVVLSIAPNADRLGQNLSKGDDEILGKEVELAGVTAA